MTHKDIQQRRARVAELTHDGWTTRQIANHLNILKRTVDRDKVKAGVAQGKSPPWSDTENHRAQTLIQDGCSYTEVARTLGRSIHAIRTHFPGHGWTYSQAGQFGMAIRKLG
jgi:IS30 family transposase